jgi:3-dehydroquinate synthase
VTAMPASRDVELRTYRVTVAPGLLDRVGTFVWERAPAHRVAVITDDEVGPRYAQRVVASLGPVNAQVIAVPAGEAQKTRETWAHVTDVMLASGFGRDTTIVALGGGVIGDLAGFVAATFMRGVPLLQVPTTLLAMVDASIGGKTGVDTPAGKNLVGAFHQPAAVLVDPETLATLPIAHLRAGMAEVIKHGVIADERYFARVVDCLPRSLERHAVEWLETLIPLVVRSIEIKADVVNRDEREAGLRKTLNFGHTLGHAIERCSNYEILHGEAVAAGMVLESDLAEQAGVAERGTAERIRAAVAAAGLPAGPPAGLRPAEVLAATRSDKKARRGVVEYALPRRIGAMACAECGWGCAVSDELVLAVLK